MLKVRGIVFSALFAALFVVFSYVRIHLPYTPVPIVLENIVPMLAGALLGSFYGFFSMLLVVVLTALGVPMLGGSGGIGDILGFSGGFVVAWPFNALLTGWFIKRVKGNIILQVIGIFLAIEVFGALFAYVIGVPWLAVAAKMSIGKAMVGGCYPFLFGDTLKAVVATIVTLIVRQVYPVGLIGSTRHNVVTLEA